MKNLNKCTESKGIKVVLKLYPTKKNSATDHFTDKFYQISKKDV